MTSRHRIMVVDDNPTILRLLSAMLENKFEIKMCLSGEEALETIRGFQPHILLLDIMMPGIDGHEVSRKIRQIDELGSIKILFVSAKTSLRDRLEGYKAGADDYLVKPFEEEELLAKIRVFIKLITEEENQKRIEEILKQSEEKYRSLVQNSPDTIINVDRDGGIRFINKAMNGKSPERVVGTKIYSYIPSEYHEEVRESFQRVFGTGEISQFEFHVEREGEPTTWFSTSVAPIRQNGEVEAATLVSRDITEKKRSNDELRRYRDQLESLVRERTNDLSETNERLREQIEERKKTEELLQKSEEKYRSILENIEEGYYEIDLRGGLNFHNDSLAKILNRPKEEMADLDFTTLLDDVNTDNLRRIFSQVYKDEIPVGSFSWDINRQKGGEQKYLETSISLIKERGKRVGFRGVVRDVTERQQHENSLEKLYNHAVATLARAAEVYDSNTGDHTVRIGDYGSLLAKLVGMNTHYQKDIRTSGQLHDVGKIHIASALLNKNERLTNDEFEKIKNHTLYGAIIIGKNPDFKMANEIAMFHHEQWNGGGYPDGLKGRAIPLSARITSIVDVFDALISKRSYKNAFDYDEAREIMISGDSRLDPTDSFDPNLRTIFLENYHQFTEIHRKSIDREKEFLARRFNVVLLEENQEFVSTIKSELEEVLPYVDVHVFSTVNHLTECLGERTDFLPDLCFLGVSLSDGSGHDAAVILKSKYPDAHLICVTDRSDIDIQKVNLYGHRVFRKPTGRMTDFVETLIKTTEIIREYNYNMNRL